MAPTTTYTYIAILTDGKTVFEIKILGKYSMEVPTVRKTIKRRNEQEIGFKPFNGIKIVYWTWTTLGTMELRSDSKCMV